MEAPPDFDVASRAVAPSGSATDETQGAASQRQDASKRDHDEGDGRAAAGAKRLKLQAIPCGGCPPVDSGMTSLGAEDNLVSTAGPQMEGTTTALAMPTPPHGATASSARSYLAGIGSYFGGVLTDLKAQFRHSSDNGIETRMGSEADGPFDSIDDIQAQIANAAAPDTDTVSPSAGLLAADGAGSGGAGTGSEPFYEGSRNGDGRGFAINDASADNNNLDAGENDAMSADVADDDGMASGTPGNSSGDLKSYGARGAGDGSLASGAAEVTGEVVVDAKKTLRNDTVVRSNDRAIDSGPTAGADSSDHSNPAATDQKHTPAGNSNCLRAEQSLEMEFPADPDNVVATGGSTQLPSGPMSEPHSVGTGSTGLDADGMGALDFGHETPSRTPFMNSRNFTTSEGTGGLNAGNIGTDVVAKVDARSDVARMEDPGLSAHFANELGTVGKLRGEENVQNGVQVDALPAPSLNVEAPSAEMQAGVAAGHSVGDEDARAAMAAAIAAASVISPPISSRTDVVSAPAGSLSFGQSLAFGQPHVEHAPSGTPNFTRDESHPCGECGIAFHNSSALKYHSDNFHGFEALRDGGEPASRPRPFPCLTCGRAFLRTGDLNRHRNVVHKRVRKSICTICNAGFGHAGDRNRHVVRVHEKGEFHQCELCAATFGSKAAYTAHLKIHSRRLQSGTPFACTHCSKAFATDQERQLHSTEVHVVNKHPCQFEMCEESFPTARSLKAHVHVKHEQVLRCELCPATFRKPAELFAHAGKRHSLEASNKSS
jgi:hypothetical protein